MNTLTKGIIAAALSIILLSGGFIAGYAFGGDRGSAVLPSTQSPVADRVDEVQKLLQREALKPSNENSATAGAIQGLLEANGDKYATYFNAQHFKFFNEESMGEFGGIGVVLGERDGGVYVVEVYDKTPAKGAGIKAGDLFTAIDGVRRDRWTSDEVVKRVRGPKGTDVKLTMTRPAKGKTPKREYTVNVTRAMITLPNIKSSMIGKVGYIRLGQFNAKSDKDIADAIESLTKKGAKSFVLDLRDNPGGLLDEAVKVTSLFIPSGRVVSVESRKGPTEHQNATGEQVTKAPLVVLINENSASASEIVAGALQDYKRAQLVGQKSFGKGSVQTVEQLSFGGAVKFTIAHYLTPKGRSIDGKGLKPDVEVKMDLEKQMDRKTDIQLKKALEIAGKEAR